MKKINQIEPSYNQKEIKAVADYLKSGGWITEHSKTKEFEKVIASFVGSKYCVTFPNGMLTLWASLIVLGIGRGDEVLVPDFTMVATANAVRFSGAEPVFVDIDKETLCMDYEATIKKITKKTKAIFLVSINGRCPNIEKFVELSKNHNLYLVEDAAQSLGSYVNGKHLGTFGIMGSFSFSMPKIITTGQGGALVTNDEKIYNKLCKFKDFGRSKSGGDDYEILGCNLKFSDLLAVFGIEQMKKIEYRIKKKKELLKWYREYLKDFSQVKFIETSEETSPWFIDILVENRAELMVFLNEKGISTRPFYPVLHALSFYKKNGVFNNSTYISNNGLWLPSSINLTRKEVKYVCQQIRSFYS